MLNLCECAPQPRPSSSYPSLLCQIANGPPTDPHSQSSPDAMLAIVFVDPPSPVRISYCPHSIHHLNLDSESNKHYLPSIKFALKITQISLQISPTSRRWVRYLTKFPPLPFAFRILLRRLRHLDRIVDDQVHKFIEPPNFPLNARAYLLIQPDAHGGALLQKLEDEVDGREEHAPSSATTTGSAGHGYCCWGFVEGRKCSQVDMYENARHVPVDATADVHGSTSSHESRGGGNFLGQARRAAEISWGKARPHARDFAAARRSSAKRTQHTSPSSFTIIIFGSAPPSLPCPY